VSLLEERNVADPDVPASGAGDQKKSLQFGTGHHQSLREFCHKTSTNFTDDFTSSYIDQHDRKNGREVWQIII
jgi:hypothetical protein